MTRARAMPGDVRRKAALMLPAALAMAVVLGLGNAHADQTATVTNDGAAGANTGGNTAVGNASDNVAVNDQDAQANAGGAVVGGGDAVASNSGGASNQSDGRAKVATGDATAVGVASTTATSQKSSGSTGTNQNATVTNDGAAGANTGGNTAVGNASDNVAVNDQDAQANAGGAVVGGGDAVAANNGGASNRSNGTAVVATGDATAVGVASNTAVKQQSQAGGGLVLADQTAVVANRGIALANTGGNVAIGNASDNVAVNDQDAEANAGGFLFGWGDAIAFNVGGASNHSNGTAVVVTGDATAVGVHATTVVNQVVRAAGCHGIWFHGGCWFGHGGLVLADQTAVGANRGVALANTGGNVAIGNASDNVAVNDQDAEANAGGFLFGWGDAIAFNVGGASNVSNGLAVVSTGNATAVGVLAATLINQSISS